MHNHSDGKDKKGFGINLLSNPQITYKWIPRTFRSQYSWQILSGKWRIESPNRIIYLKQPNMRTGENVSIIGSNNWADFNFQVKFKILTKSIKPPEGGVILYFLFKNIRNYYSFHFCLPKKKVELIKRLHGNWSIISEKRYNFETQKDYKVTINTISSIHQCQIEGIQLIKKFEKDISNGCIGIGVKYCDVEFSHVSISVS
ncbi:MAG: hypothetical protein SWO11_04080 [Thermodesulfobacteriota bacterium]|nr:hypothetical protein [Thermodesulfobacteriota bacterium]